MKRREMSDEGKIKSSDKEELTEKMALKISGAKFIAETFKGYGITHVFFVDGILRHALAEMEALGIRRVLAHSEKAAAYMADGYSRACRRPGICMSQSVGAANLAAGLQDAFLGLSAVIGITGRKEPFLQHRNAYQEILHHPLFDPVTKYNVHVDTAEQLPYLLRQAFREATSASPGPVHLDVLGHTGHITDQWEIGGGIVIEDAFTRYPSQRPEPEDKHVQEAARLLADAERPVIVAGGGAVSSSAGPEISKFSKTLSIPVATSLNGKGILLEDHPLNMGIVGSYSRRCANKVVSEADLVLFIGSRTGDLVTNNWTVPKPETPVIQIDIEPSELGRNYPNKVSLLGDAKVSVSKLLEVLHGADSKDPWAQYAKKTLNEWREEAEPLRNSDASPIRPERLCKELSDLLPTNAVLVADTGYSGIWTGIMFYLTHPQQTYIRAAGSLGWAFPASLGAKCALPERPVVCFTGDGGFWYHLSELETAVRYGINTITVVNNNRCFSQCEAGVKKAYGDMPGKRHELYRFGEVNFSRIGEEMGCFGIRVEQPEAIAPALRQAFEAGRPAVVEIITDEKCKAPWTPAY